MPELRITLQRSGGWPWLAEVAGGSSAAKDAGAQYPGRDERYGDGDGHGGDGWTHVVDREIPRASDATPGPGIHFAVRDVVRNGVLLIHAAVELYRREGERCAKDGPEPQG